MSVYADAKDSNESHIEANSKRLEHCGCEMLSARFTAYVYLVASVASTIAFLMAVDNPECVNNDSRTAIVGAATSFCTFVVVIGSYVFLEAAACKKKKKEEGPLNAGPPSEEAKASYDAGEVNRETKLTTYSGTIVPLRNQNHNKGTSNGTNGSSSPTVQARDKFSHYTLVVPVLLLAISELKSIPYDCF